MKTIFSHAKDVDVRKFVAYGKTADQKLYYEADYKTQVTPTDAEDAFKKGMLLIMDGTTMLIPVSMAGTVIKTVAASESGVSLTSWDVTAPTTA